MRLANAAAAVAAAAGVSRGGQSTEYGKDPILALTKLLPESLIFVLFFPRLNLHLLKLRIRILFRQSALRLQVKPLHGRGVVILIVPRRLLLARLVKRGDNDKLKQATCYRQRV